MSDRTESDSRYDLAVEAWRRRKWVAVLAFVGAAAGATTAVLSLPDLYRATASALVERQQVSEAFVRPSVTAELETRIQTIREQVMSRARLTDVITRLGLYPELRGVVPIDAIADRMRREIRLDLKGVDQAATGRAATIAFTITYTGRDPATVARVANTLVELYVEENTRSRERQAEQTAGFLKKQLDEIKQELDAQQQREREFKSRHTTELPQQLEANLAALERLNTQLRLNGEYQIRAIERRERLENQLAETRVAAPAASASAAPSQLAQLRQELAALRKQFSDQYPDVIRLKAQIAALEQQAQQAEPAVPDGQPPAAQPDPAARLKHSFAAVDAELATLKSQERFLRQVIDGYEARVESAPKRQQELQDLSRDSETTKERYNTLLKRYEDAQLAASLEAGQNVEQFRVLDPALPPRQPAAPDRFWLLVMGLFGSVGLAFGAVVAAEKLDTTFHTLDDLRAFVRVPTLATIRPIVTDADVRRGRRRAALVAVLFVVGLVLVVAGAYYVAAGNEQLVRLTARAGG